MGDRAKLKRGDVFRTLPSFDYFSEKSRAKLKAVLDASPTWDVMESPRTWTVKTGCAWTKYFPAPEFWTSPERVGYMMTDKSETMQDFLKASNLTWKEGDRYGRVLGPTDKCR